MHRKKKSDGDHGFFHFLLFYVDKIVYPRMHIDFLSIAFILYFLAGIRSDYLQAEKYKRIVLSG
jgi:hypothetical protein